MKKLIYFLTLPLLIFCSTSCVTENEINPDIETDPVKVELVEKMITTADYKVPVVDGFITTVSYNGQVLARTSKPITIKVPKTSTSRGADDINIDYSEGTLNASYSSLWQTVMFEDTKTGDYDYNDLVFHVQYERIGTKLKVSIHPIALGSSKILKLRLKYTQGGVSKVIKIAENCREELFNNISGFINTRNYDIHFQDFATSFEVDLDSESEVVDYAWFINVNDAELIYAVNTNSNVSLDSNNRPYGFAITDIGTNSSNSNSITKNKEDIEEWNDEKPEIGSWAKIPDVPQIPTKTTTFSNSLKASTNYLLSSGSVISGDIKGASGATVYVEGELVLTNEYSANDYKGTKIIVMPKGKLTIDKQDFNNINIINYGTIEWKQKSPKFYNNASFISNNNINEPELQLQVRNKSNIAIYGDVVASDIVINHNSTSYCKAYFNSVKANKLESYNDAFVYVNGSLTVNNLKTNNSDEATTYIDCRLTASESVILSKSSKTYINGYMSTPYLEMAIKSELYISSTSIVSCPNINIANMNQCTIEVVGDNYAILDASKITSANIKKDCFEGNINIINATFYKNGKAVTLKFDDDSDIRINDKSISIAKNNCNPGYNTNGTPDDNGATWFAYPRENVNISLCYNFSKWLKGDFDFSLLSTADVFDINDEMPAIGTKKKIYTFK
ncbi:MAG: hypothetical protein PHR45_02305 [Muribaculaceae bacterium]|nr:hypothetical protein [Muribaculaceae bacterium]